MDRHEIRVAFEDPSDRLVCATCLEPVGTIAFVADPDGEGSRVISFLVHGGDRAREARRRSWRESKRRARARSAA